MSGLKAVLFDGDGVTIIPSEPFSIQYAKAHGLEPTALDPFIFGDFQQAMIGKADLRDLLETQRALWQWKGPVDDLIHQWCEAENHPNLPLVELIGKLREQGTRCYLATNQEQHRTKFIREHMFPDVFDAIFSSAELGAMKPSEAFFRAVLGKLAMEGIEMSQITFFDDSQKNVAAAEAMGIQSHLYTSLEDVQPLLKR